MKKRKWEGEVHTQIHAAAHKMLEIWGLVPLRPTAKKYSSEKIYCNALS
jgi:hypothetical protein